LGSLGRKRTFAVYDRTADLKLPSDLAGVTIADYQTQSTGNLRAALGAACTSIKNVVSELGRRERNPISASIDQNTQFQIIHDLMDNADEQFMILMHDTGTSLRIDGPYSPGYKYTYRCHDRTAGQGHFSASKLCDQLPDAGLLDLDLRRNMMLTKRGHEYAAWLVKRGYKAEWFETALGGWGEKPDDFPDFNSPSTGPGTPNDSPQALQPPA